MYDDEKRISRRDKNRKVEGGDTKLECSFDIG